MPIPGTIGKGTILSTAATSTVVKIANIQDVKPPKKVFGKIDGTKYDDLLEQMKPGWLNAGEVTFKLLYTIANAVTLNALLGVEDQYWKVTLPDGGNWTFQGWLSELGGDAPIKGMCTNEGTIVITSIPMPNLS